MSVFNDLLGDLDVFFKRLGGSIDHNGCETVIDTGLAGLKCITVVKMQADRQTGLDNCSFNQLYKISTVGISTCAFGNLKDDRSVAFLCSFCDTLDDLHVVDVESTNGVTTVVSFLKHFF